MTTFTHDTYLSPFTWRYGSPEMRRLWSEAHKRRLWRRIWVALAEAEQAAGLVTAEQVADLRAHQEDVVLARAHEIEAEIHHDLMAEVRTYAEQCPVGGGIIHLGATSMDIEDNADALRLRDALDLVLVKLRKLLLAFADQIERWADAPTMAFTHLQPAEPTTVGYRLAQYAQDLLADYDELSRARADIRGKGFKGAVGTSASYVQLLGAPFSTAADNGIRNTQYDPEPLAYFEQAIMSALSLEAFPVATQTYPRKQDYRVVSTLAGLGASLYKFAFDLRVLQSPPIGEWAEPFATRQVGSSAMPFKRNPIHAENMDSLARYLAALPRVAWDNAAHNLLERTLDDSANRRSLLPEAFLITDELLRRGLRLIEGLRINRDASERLLAAYGPFAATERLLMELVKRGGDRQELHEVIREHAMTAWAEVQAGRLNPLRESLCADIRITQHASQTTVLTWLDAADYIGDAPARARALADTIRQRFAAERRKMRLYAFDHVQLDMPAGQEARARDFYARVLGLAEIAKPPEFAKRGGAWFGNGAVTVHLGAVAEYCAPIKAHPAFLVEGLSGLISHLEQAGYPISRDIPIPGYDRVHVLDPFGNRIELMERIGEEIE